VTQANSDMLVALGSNLPEPQGSPAANLVRALSELRAEGLNVCAVSRFFETPCFPAGAGPDYINAAVRLCSDLDACAVLEKMHRIEARMGRQRQTRWGMRTLDLDLIAIADRVLPDLDTYRHWRALHPQEQRLRAPDELVLPHPRLEERAFVLVPLADIAPDWHHPVSGVTVTDMLAALPRDIRQAVRPI